MRGEDVRAGDPQDADANEVLAAHHRVLRGLTDQIDSAEEGSPEHRGLIDHLVLELNIHIRIEDALYYPAVAKVSPLVAVAHAEHRGRSPIGSPRRCGAIRGARSLLSSGRRSPRLCIITLPRRSAICSRRPT